MNIPKNQGVFTPSQAKIEDTSLSRDDAIQIAQAFNVVAEMYAGVKLSITEVDEQKVITDVLKVDSLLTKAKKAKAVELYKLKNEVI